MYAIDLQKNTLLSLTAMWLSAYVIHNRRASCYECSEDFQKDIIFIKF
jgi:hypothetical protein